MDNPEKLDWISLLRVDAKWINNLLLTHDSALTGKMIVRSYSLKFAGTQEHLKGLVEFMANSILHFVYSDSEIEELVTKGKNPWKEARDYFGDVDPIRDGKSGELLLFLIVEAVLKIPLIAHKIRVVSDNPNDQVKGSDGVFLGNYDNHTAFLFGEAKIHGERNVGINKSLESINKLYDGVNANRASKNELCVVRERLTKNLSLSQLKFLDKALDIQSEEYRYLNTVHPVLVVYDDSKITKIQQNGSSPQDCEEQANKEFAKLSSKILPIIAEKLDSEFQSLKRVYLDFFFVPISSANLLRDLFYFEIHNTPYRRKADNV